MVAGLRMGRSLCGPDQVSYGATLSIYLDFVGEVGGQGRSRACSDEELPRGHRELQYTRVILCSKRSVQHP